MYTFLMHSLIVMYNSGDGIVARGGVGSSSSYNGNNNNHDIKEGEGGKEEGEGVKEEVWGTNSMSIAHNISISSN